MEISFALRELAELYECEAGTEDYPPDIVDNFFYQLATVAAAKNEADLLSLKSLPLTTCEDYYLLELGDSWSISLLIKTALRTQTVEVDLVHTLERSLL